MAEVVFLRGVNVGGARKFQPSKLAAALKQLDVISLGAAGTFVVRARVSRKELQAELQRQLPFACDILMCSGKEILSLVAEPPFPTKTQPPDHKWYVTIINEAAQAKLPLNKPAGAEWQVRVVAIVGRFVLSLHRRVGRTLIYPNEVVEKSFGIIGTTRGWPTIVSIAEILEGK